MIYELEGRVEFGEKMLKAGNVGVSVRGGRLRVGAVPYLFSFTSSLCRIIRLVSSPAYPD